MWTLTLRGGARVTVVAAEWRDAFGVVTRGRVQLELRDGEPGPVLGRGAGFWLRGIGVRALQNPRLSRGEGAHRHPQGQDLHMPVNTPVRQLPNDGGTA
ncbi:hypothetical protein [Streptomyces sp. 6-11-2]|uniref:hypothetical protein n=1 Tax=Streptomyces sp. 6-11-2 TaxID=2585753 RepID=UPI001167CF63|nr:hypothetical protein [Streptomyces sp. 6-11-2]GED90028.1 hypothetical protein TNCT6_71130 [Streptomyces sp. 6-11-2]